jgi:hypothetical protein
MSAARVAMGVCQTRGSAPGRPRPALDPGWIAGPGYASRGIARPSCSRARRGLPGHHHGGETKHDQCDGNRAPPVPPERCKAMAALSPGPEDTKKQEGGTGELTDPAHAPRLSARARSQKHSGRPEHPSRPGPPSRQTRQPQQAQQPRPVGAVITGVVPVEWQACRDPLAPVRDPLGGGDYVLVRSVWHNGWVIIVRQSVTPSHAR